MNKTIIALAIATALPVAAQADMTLSGSVQSQYRNNGANDTDASLSAAVSEVLANGMTATAAFNITADSDDDTENQGTVSLAGDFGSLTAGEIDADSAFQAGDVAGIVSDTTYGTGSTASNAQGISYSGSVAGLTVAAQVNANTDAAKVGAVTGVPNVAAVTGTSLGTNFLAAKTAPLKSTQLSATYDLNGMIVGYSYASADVDNRNSTAHEGVNEGQSLFGVSYSFGDLVVSAGKQNLKTSTAISPDTVVSATYTMALDAFTIKAQMDSAPSGDYQVDLAYAINDSLTLSSEIDKTAGTDNTMVATYTSGNITAIVASQDDKTTDASIAIDMGNADITVGRVGERAASVAGIGRPKEAEYSHVTYKVSF